MKKYILYLFCLVGVLSGCEKKEDPTTITNPTINSIEPSAGMAGSEVFITGKNFDSDTTKVSIIVDGQKGKIKQISFGKIIAILPTALNPGPKKITLIQNGYTNSDFQFEIYAFPQNITIESTTALIGDKVKIVVNDLNPKLTCKITGIIDGKEIEAEQGTSSNEFFISIPQAGSVELRMNTIPIKGISLTVYDPSDLLTNHPWVIKNVDRWLSLANNNSKMIYNYEGIIGEFNFNKDGTFTYTENGVTLKKNWKIKDDPNSNKLWIQFDDVWDNELEKLTVDSLVFRWIAHSDTYKLIPIDKVPVVQEIPDLPFNNILTRPRLWILCVPIATTGYKYFGSTLTFLPDGTLSSYDLKFDETRTGKWSIENVLGKPYLKLIAGDGSFIQYECTEISFYKFEIKDFNSYYAPRYW